MKQEKLTAKDILIGDTDFIGKKVDRETGEIAETLPIVKNWLNNHLFPRSYEENDGQSLSIPDQSLTVAQMLERQSKGLPISFNQGTPYYLGDEEMPDVQKMDISEIQDLKEFIYEKKKAAQEAAVAQRQRKDQALADELAEYRKLKAEKAANPGQSATQKGDEVA